MSRLIRIACLLIVCSTTARGGVYVSESFTGSTAPNWLFSSVKTTPGPYLTADASHRLDAPGTGWLRLTENVANQSNAAFYDKAISLTPGAGLCVAFDFAVYNGTGADGLTFSLLDGAVAKPVAGGYGGSMGYANRSYVDGVPGGYLSVGFDELGNYSNPTEGRNGGPGGTPNAVAVRGAGNGQAGYAYITGTKNQGNGFLDYRTSTVRPSQADSHYRRAIISLREQSPSELLLTVQIQRGFGTAPVTYINNFNVIGTFGGYVQPGLPSSLRFGFTAGTGALNEIHEVRNLTVGTYGSASIVTGGSIAAPEPGSGLGAIAGLAALPVLLRRKRRERRCGRSGSRPLRSSTPGASSGGAGSVRGAARGEA